jgi:hypothetical protein
MALFNSGRLERGVPCWLLKLRKMGTQGVQMKGEGGLSWYGLLGSLCQYKIFVLSWLLYM